MMPHTAATATGGIQWREMPRAGRPAAWLTLALLVAAVSRALVPTGPVRVGAERDGFWAGVLHVHTSQSDGSGTPETIAAAAAAAGLDYVILTDHGDGTRPPAAPVYLSGVLVIDAVEISTDAGHYLALGMQQAPYPLAGNARAVAEDVARFGGLGLLAHPDSTREALAWHAPDVRGDGLELLNADSAWRDESLSGLLARLLPYPWRPASVLASTLDYPADLLTRLDTPDPQGPRLAVAGVDAHARIGWRPRDDPQDGGRTLARWPSYAASFGTFGMVVPWTRGRAPIGDPVEDARSVIDAFRTHRAHVAVFALGDATPVLFSAVTQGAVYPPGSRLESRSGVTLVVEAPRVPQAWIRLLRNGHPWRGAAPGDRLVVPVSSRGAPAIYRAEVWLPQRWRQPSLPWLVSQAIAVDLPDGPRAAIGPDDERVTADDGLGRRLDGPWQVEHDPCSTIAVSDDDAAEEAIDSVGASRGAGSAASIEATLCDSGQASPFAAARLDWPTAAAGASTVSFVASAAVPMRVSVQVREPTDGDGRRWMQSIYLDATPRRYTLPLDHLQAIAPARGAPPVNRLHALLFVVDSVNTPPGARRRFSLRGLRIS